MIFMSEKKNPGKFKGVSVREDLYNQLVDFFDTNKGELQRRRIYNLSQLVDVSARCFMTCEKPITERLF